MNPTAAGRTTSTLIDAVVARPGNDPIFLLNAEAKERASRGESILNATLGALLEDDGRLAILPSVFEAYERVPKERAATYAPIAGAPEFLEAVTRDVFGSRPVGEKTVAVATPGATGAIQHATVNFLEQGQAILVPSYFWGPYHIIAVHARRAIETFRMFDEEGRFDVHAFEEGLARLIARQGRALVFLNFPCNNPTGYTLHQTEWRAVHDIVRRHAAKAPVTILIDLAYAEFGTSESRCWKDFVEGMAEFATVVVAWTASKSMAQYGARVGALLAVNESAEERERIRNALGFACRGTWSNCNHLGMLAIAEVLRDADLASRAAQEREHLKSLLGERVEVFNREARSAGLSFPRYEGGFFVSVFTPDAELTAKRMKKDGVFVVPMKGAVRAALCATPKSEVPRLVASMKSAIEAVG